MKKVYVLLAEGFETIEALTPVDVMHRAGVEVKTVSISETKKVMSSHNVTVEADMILNESNLSDGDAIVVPGGFPGYVNLGESKAVGEVVKKYYEAHKFVAAICGGPTVLVKNGIAKGKKITCHHSVKDQMTDYNYAGGATVQDGNLITAIGAGHSVDFAIAIAANLTDEATVAKIKAGMEI